MKVCMSHNFGITPKFGGGIGSVILNLVNQTKNEIDYTLVTAYNKEDLEIAKTLYGPKVQIINIKTENDFFIDSLSYLTKIPLSDYDIVHFHDLPAGRTFPLALRSKIRRLNPVFSYHYDQSFQTHYPFKYGVGSAYYHFFLKRSFRFWKRIIVNSKITLADFSNNKDYLSKVRLIPNGVNMQEIAKAHPRGIEGSPSFLHVGHLEWAKGVDILLEAFSKVVSNHNLVDPHLHLIGDGELDSYCKAFVQRNGLTERVHLWGAQPQNVVFEIMKGCDIFVFPSRYEGFGIVVLEAMAAEKPIISTKVGGVPDIMVAGRNGLLIEPRIKNLVGAMQTMGLNPDQCKQYSNNNAKDIKRFSWSEISKKYTALYNEVVSC
jgi:glycosyltransferase involved in cell wall biosynthesis